MTSVVCGVTRDGGAQKYFKPWEFNINAPVLLLCGPPGAHTYAQQQLHTQPRARLTHAYHCAGFGKTTLAHIAARHCGYTPVEINASDDRSGGTLLRRVENAMEMRSVFGSRKPNLGKVEVLAHTLLPRGHDGRG